MNRFLKVVLIATGILVAFWVSTAAVLAHGLRWASTLPALDVRVEDHLRDAHVRLRVPAAVVAAGVALAPAFDGDPWAKLPGDLEARRWAPAAAELARHLEDAPDATLVEVVQGTERVRVEKRGDALRVLVRSADADVDVTLPAALLRELADALEGSAR
jgi:hypothetical protein